jgi:ubiquinone/menaquinone biosynthesis C-methylase UbiE
MGDEGDFSREFLLDAPMLKQVELAQPLTELDVGCGEGRFCRMMSGMGISATGMDPITAMIDATRARDPQGDYHIGFAEDLPFEDSSFDLVVSYLTLIDIDDPAAAIAQMVRVLRPNGRLLIANLSSFATSYLAQGNRICRDTGEDIRPLGDYLNIHKISVDLGGLVRRTGTDHCHST